FEVSDDAPAAMVMDSAGRALREHDGEDVESSVGLGVEEVPYCLALERLASLGQYRFRVEQQGLHGRPDRLGPGPVRVQRGVVQRGAGDGDQSLERGGHRAERSV